MPAAGPCEIDVREFLKLIESLGKQSELMTPTLKVAAEMLVSEVQDYWRSAGGGTWPPLAPSTLEHRRGTTAQILIDTGRAIASVQAYAGPDFAQAATDTDYMRYHCGDGPRTKIPKRDPFDLPDEAQERVLEFVMTDLVARWMAQSKPK